jgi:hypothetical protein
MSICNLISVTFMFGLDFPVFFFFFFFFFFYFFIFLFN